MGADANRPRVLRALKLLHGVAIESPIKAGTPDVNFCEGWVELKTLKAWPVRPDTIVRLPHYTLHQRRWLRDRWRVGSSAWLLLSVRREWLLFTGQDAHDKAGKVTKEELINMAYQYWPNGLNDAELRRTLTSWEGA